MTRAKYGWIDQWRTEADEDFTLAGFVGAFAVLAMWMVVLYLAYVTLWAAQ